MIRCILQFVFELDTLYIVKKKAFFLICNHQNNVNIYPSVHPIVPLTSTKLFKALSCAILNNKH